MSYTYLLEQGEESLAECFSDIPACVLSRLSLTAAKSCCNGSETESFQSSRYGTMCEPLTAGPGKEKSTLFAQAFHANELAVPERAGDSSTRTITKPLSASFAKWGPGLYFWKTPHFLFAEDSHPFSGTWPRWGMMVNGECWELPTPDFLTNGSDSGQSLPTPSGVNGGKNHTMGRIDEWGGSSNPLRGTTIGYLCLPEFEELVMGWPVTWTALMPLETVKFQRWLQQHGEF